MEHDSRARIALVVLLDGRERAVVAEPSRLESVGFELPRGEESFESESAVGWRVGSARGDRQKGRRDNETVCHDGFQPRSSAAALIVDPRPGDAR